MNTFISTIFVAIFAVCFCVILFILFTKKGKGAFVKAGFGKILKDYGDIGSSKIKGFITQTIHLYECSDGKENFFILEARMVTRVEYVKISSETAKNLIKVISATSLSAS